MPVSLSGLCSGGVVPVPEETALAFSGYLVYRGTFRAFPACAAAFLGSVCGITLSYTLGRELGWGICGGSGGFSTFLPRSWRTCAAGLDWRDFTCWKGSSSKPQVGHRKP